MRTNEVRYISDGRLFIQERDTKVTVSGTGLESGELSAGMSSSPTGGSVRIEPVSAKTQAMKKANRTERVDHSRAT